MKTILSPKRMKPLQNSAWPQLTPFTDTLTHSPNNRSPKAFPQHGRSPKSSYSYGNAHTKSCPQLPNCGSGSPDSNNAPTGLAVGTWQTSHGGTLNKKNYDLRHGGNPSKKLLEKKRAERILSSSTDGRVSTADGFRGGKLVAPTGPKGLKKIENLNNNSSADDASLVNVKSFSFTEKNQDWKDFLLHGDGHTRSMEFPPDNSRHNQSIDSLTGFNSLQFIGEDEDFTTNVNPSHLSNSRIHGLKNLKKTIHGGFVKLQTSNNTSSGTKKHFSDTSSSSMFPKIHNGSVTRNFQGSGTNEDALGSPQNSLMRRTTSQLSVNTTTNQNDTQSTSPSRASFPKIRGQRILLDSLTAVAIPPSPDHSPQSSMGFKGFSSKNLNIDSDLANGNNSEALHSHLKKLREDRENDRLLKSPKNEKNIHSAHSSHPSSPTLSPIRRLKASHLSAGNSLFSPSNSVLLSPLKDGDVLCSSGLQQSEESKNTRVTNDKKDTSAEKSNRDRLLDRIMRTSAAHSAKQNAAEKKVEEHVNSSTTEDQDDINTEAKKPLRMEESAEFLQSHINKPSSPSRTVFNNNTIDKALNIEKSEATSCCDDDEEISKELLPDTLDLPPPTPLLLTTGSHRNSLVSDFGSVLGQDDTSTRGVTPDVVGQSAREQPQSISEHQIETSSKPPLSAAVEDMLSAFAEARKLRENENSATNVAGQKNDAEAKSHTDGLFANFPKSNQDCRPDSVVVPPRTEGTTWKGPWEKKNSKESAAVSPTKAPEPSVVNGIRMKTPQKLSNTGIVPKTPTTSEKKSLSYSSFVSNRTIPTNSPKSKEHFRGEKSSQNSDSRPGTNYIALLKNPETARSPTAQKRLERLTTPVLAPAANIIERPKGPSGQAGKREPIRATEGNIKSSEDHTSANTAQITTMATGRALVELKNAIGGSSSTGTSKTERSSLIDPTSSLPRSLQRSIRNHVAMITGSQKDTASLNVDQNQSARDALAIVQQVVQENASPEVQKRDSTVSNTSSVTGSSSGSYSSSSEEFSSSSKEPASLSGVSSMHSSNSASKRSSFASSTSKESTLNQGESAAVSEIESFAAEDSPEQVSQQDCKVEPTVTQQSYGKWSPVLQSQKYGVEAKKNASEVQDYPEPKQSSEQKPIEKTNDELSKVLRNEGI